ncbi:MAG: sigma-70 family RNA polymerase sigma factor, partial [Acidimicrobiia bacterium]|nr:sigma-70 family RNA polymerase sigma factor [Acidimicrobiia bacterium]
LPVLTDRELVDQFVAGDQSAFTQLMQNHEDRIFGLCLRMLRDRTKALDATQETFLTLYRKADKYHGKSAFSTWLYRVAVNTCYDQMRKEKRKKADALPAHLDPVDPHVTDEMRAVELRPDIEAALATLQPEFRSAVILVDMEGHSLETAAEMLEVPIGTVKSRVFRGRRILASNLGNLSNPSATPRDDRE